MAKSELKIKGKKGSWYWPDMKYLSAGVVVITIIISLFDFYPDLSVWIIEILRNLVITICITLTTFALSIIFRMNKVILKWTFFFWSFILFAVGGFLGGLIAWGINELLFGFNITHPWFYFVITASLSIIFGFIVFGYLSIQLKFIETAAKLAQKEVNEQKLSKLKTIAQLEALRAKVNPHFLFNTLNSIASLIPEDPEKAEEVVQKLSNLFRYSLDTSGESFVQLGKEIEFIREYLEVEKVRLGERLNYTIEIEDGLEDHEIPGMLIQPLVENSVKHGISATKRGGEIGIKVSRDGNRCVIFIVDTGAGFQDEITEGFGISGVKERLNLQYKSDYEFDITTTKGVTIRIAIPLNNTMYK